MFRPTQDYVLTRDGRAWLAQGSKITPFASESLETSLRLLVAKRAVLRRDPRSLTANDRALSDLFSKPDKGAVSMASLGRFSKAMRVPIRQGAPAKMK